MKKILISIVIVLILALTVVTVLNGINLGNFTVLGINNIKEESSKLETKIEEATKLASTTYYSELTTLDSNLKEMKTQKQKYEDMLATTTESEMQTAIQEQVYTIDKIWSKIGTYATDGGLTAAFELTEGTRIPVKRNNQETDYKYYNINFTVLGGYANISLYMSDIEKDSELSFKFENFKMEPSGDGGIVKATFVCKDIAIKGISTSTISTPNEQGGTEGATGTGETGTNGTTNNTTGTNTTNTTNTNNTADTNTANVGGNATTENNSKNTNNVSNMQY